MQYLLLALFCSAFFSVTSAFANECLDNISEHDYVVLLDLSMCNLQDDDIRQVAQYASHQPYLHTLQLSANNIGPQGVRHLVGVNNFSTLSIENNHLGNEGAAVISTMRNIKVLGAAGNNIKHDVLW